MNVITSFKEKRKEKQVTYERKVLRELSLEGLKNKAKDQFSMFIKSGSVLASAIEEGCLDVAIEGYLLGAKYSRFGYYGETMESIRLRSNREEKYLVDTLFEFLGYWGQIGDKDFINESLYYACESYVDYWFLEGFNKGEKRYRLRLH